MATVVIDLRWFPFLVEPAKALELKYPGLKVEDILSNPESYPFNRALELLRTIVSYGSISKGRGVGEDEVLAFYSLLLGAIALGEKRLIRRIANAYSKEASKKLARTPLPTVVAIAKLLGLTAEISRNPPKLPIGIRSGRVLYRVKPISIPVKQYLKIASKRLAKDPKYMLSNQIVSDGKVFLDKEVFIRLLEEAIFEKIVELPGKIEFDVEKVRLFIDKYREVLEEYEWFKGGTTSIESEVTGYIPAALPPCMELLINKLRAGENLSHHERFAVAAFLSNIGLDPDAILEFFKKAPDFNERIARYQIEHIAGLRGSRKKYLPYSCDTMKSLRICPVTEPCGRGKNPLAIYRYNVYLLKKRKKEGGSP